MRRLWLGVVLAAGTAILASVGFAQHDQTAGPYKVLKTSKVGGEGGFDYITADVEGRRLYVPRNGPMGQLTAFNLDTLEPAGSIAGVKSGGAGKYRGGDGVTRCYRILAPSMHLTTCIERMVIPPFGMQGGQPGQTGRISLIRNGANVEIDGKSNLVLQQDDLVTIESCGGGGYGAE